MLLGALVVGACGSDEAVGGPARSAGGTSVTVAPTSPQTSSATSPPTSQAELVKIVGVYDDVAAYPACGNEPFEHLGVIWYPLFDEGRLATDSRLQRRVDEVMAVDREPAPEIEPHGLARVAPPGPGDDVGRLVVWEDGVARWTSDSGRLDVWAVDDEVTYHWVC